MYFIMGILHAQSLQLIINHLEPDHFPEIHEAR